MKTKNSKSGTTKKQQQSGPLPLMRVRAPLARAVDRPRRKRRPQRAFGRLGPKVGLGVGVQRQDVAVFAFFCFARVAAAAFFFEQGIVARVFPCCCHCLKVARAQPRLNSTKQAARNN
jgi:hypothetical protein